MKTARRHRRTSRVSFLTEQRDRFLEGFPELAVRQPIADASGRVYCWVLESRASHEIRFFVAKDSTWENSDDFMSDTVSIHDELIDKAVSTGIPIIMALKGRFYKLDGRAIKDAHPWPNIRDAVVMLNFSLSGARAIDITERLNPIIAREPNHDRIAGAAK